MYIKEEEEEKKAFPVKILSRQFENLFIFYFVTKNIFQGGIFDFFFSFSPIVTHGALLTTARQN